VESSTKELKRDYLYEAHQILTNDFRCDMPGVHIEKYCEREHLLALFNHMQAKLEASESKYRSEIEALKAQIADDPFAIREVALIHGKAV
jgi:hypothetical protein